MDVRGNRLHLLVPVALCLPMLGCNSANDGVALEKLPNSEWAAPFENCLSLSPDEHWLTFLRYSVPPASRGDEPGPLFHLASIDLETGARTDHTVDQVPKNAFWTPEIKATWADFVWWAVEERFRPGGWRDGLFYLLDPYGDGDLVVDPRHPPIELATKKKVHGTCSDCPPARRATTRDFDHLNLDPEMDPASWVYSGDKPVAVYYERHGEGGSTIYRSGLAGDPRIVVREPNQPGNTLRVGEIRVSPRERFLGFVTYSKGKGLFSGPSETVYVLDLQTGRKKDVIRRSYVGDLQWSPDGRRLYFAAGNMGEEAIYVLDAE